MLQIDKCLHLDTCDRAVCKAEKIWRDQIAKYINQIQPTG